MDVDCDGQQHGTGDDGRCNSSADTQSVTSFQPTVQGYNRGVRDLNAYVHTYVVLGNDGAKKGWRTFRPQAYGVEPLSVVAVVCGEQLVCPPLLCCLYQPLIPGSTMLQSAQRKLTARKIYGIWGDTNGDDGAHPMVGEAALSLAAACFGASMTGDSGHDATDVLYLAFAGADAVPGADGAAWNASSWREFEASLAPLGDELIRRIDGSSCSSGSSAAGGGAETNAAVVGGRGDCGLTGCD
jgi:hypothetical protein